MATYSDEFHAAMDDDFNTPEAISVLHSLATQINTYRESDPEPAGRLAGEMKRLGRILGLLQADPDEYFKRQYVLHAEAGEFAFDGSPAGLSTSLSDEQIEQLIEARTTARRERNWAEADRIRNELEGQGIVLEDGPSGTTWRRS